MFNFSAAGGVTYSKQISNYDENSLGISLLYPTNDAGSIQIPIFRGSPFMTFIYMNGILIRLQERVLFLLIFTLSFFSLTHNSYTSNKHDVGHH